MAKSALPAIQKTTLIRVAFNGVSEGIIINNNIPTPSEIHVESQVFAFAITLAKVKIETNTGIKQIFESIQNIILPTLKPSIVKGTPPPPADKRAYKKCNKHDCRA